MALQQGYAILGGQSNIRPEGCHTAARHNPQDGRFDMNKQHFKESSDVICQLNIHCPVGRRQRLEQHMHFICRHQDECMVWSTEVRKRQHKQCISRALLPAIALHDVARQGHLAGKGQLSYAKARKSVHSCRLVCMPLTPQDQSRSAKVLKH